jgi:hypothetical protein
LLAEVANKDEESKDPPATASALFLINSLREVFIGSLFNYEREGKLSASDLIGLLYRWWKSYNCPTLMDVEIQDNSCLLKIDYVLAYREPKCLETCGLQSI